MVDIVGAAYAVAHAEKIAYGGGYIIGDDMAGYKVVHPGLQELLELLLFHVPRFLQKLHEGGVMYLLVQTGLFGIELQVALSVHEQVAEYLYPGAVGRYDVYAVYAGVFDCLGGLAAYYFSLSGKYLAGAGSYDVFRRSKAVEARGDGEFFIKLIAAHSGKVVALVKKQGVQQAARGFLCRRLAGALALVYLYQAFLGVFGCILLEGYLQALVFAQKLQYLAV